MKFRYLLILTGVYWIFILGNVSAKSNPEIFDLLTQLRLAEHDSTKTDIYIKLADAYVGEDVDKAINNANLALILSENYKDERRKLLVYDKMLKIYFGMKYDLQTSLEYLEKAKAIDPNLTTEKDQALIEGHEGKIYLAVNDFENAQEAFFKQLQIYQRLGDELGEAQANYSLANLWYERKNFQQTLVHLTKSLEAYTHLNETQGRIETLNKMGQTYGALGDFERNLEYSSEALSLAQQIRDNYLLANINANIGFAYLHLDESGDAFKYYTTALDIAENLENKRLIAQIAKKVGDWYHEQCDEEQAFEFYYEALEAAEAINNRSLLKDIYQSFYEYYEEYGNEKEAYIFLRKVTKTKEELYSEEQNRQFINNQIRYQTAIKEEENKRLKATELENEIIIQSQRIQNYVLIFVITIVSFGIYFLYNAFKRKKEYNKELKAEVKKHTLDLEKSNEELIASNKQLEESNHELERFAYIASHDLKSPLRNIISFLNLIQRKVRNYDDDNLKEYLRFATDNAKQMNQLIQDVLEFSRVASVEVEKNPVDLNESLILVMQNVQEMMENKQAIVHAEALPVIEANSVHILQLLQNLVGNGVKYNQNENPRVAIRHRKEADHYLFSVQDNGIGIEPEFHQKIFEMFKRLHTSTEYSGTGIGLAICKKIINSLGGKIWLESHPGQGTTFYFTIPV